MQNVVKTLFTVEEARRIIGTLADQLTDEQIKDMVETYDRTARLLIRSKRVSRPYFQEGITYEFGKGFGTAKALYMR
jgi:hypothetical protein